MKGKYPQLMLISKLAIVEKIPNYLYVQPYFLRGLSQYGYLSSDAARSMIENGYYLSKFSNSQAMENFLFSLSSEKYQSSISSKKENLKSNLTSIIAKLPIFTQSIEKNLNLHKVDNCSHNQIVTDTNYAIICASQTMQQSKSQKKTLTSMNSQFADKELAAFVSENSHENDSKNESQKTMAEAINLDSNENVTFTKSNRSKEHDTLEDWIEYGITHKELISLWKISTQFRVRILLATYVNVKDVNKIFVQAGVYHGSEPLCQHRTTRPVEPHNPRWDELLEFPELSFYDLPLSARLSISLCAVMNRKKVDEEFATAWINLQLFNYQHCLLSGRMSLNLWPMPKGFEGFLNPFGHSGSNPNRYQAPRIQIEFDTFPKPVVYPSKSAVIEYATVVNKQEEQFIRRIEDLKKKNISIPSIIKTRHLTHDSSRSPYFEKPNCFFFFDGCSINRFYRNSNFQCILMKLRTLTSRLDPFVELSEQEKDFFWRERETVRKACPDALPKVLDSVRWACREEVCQMFELLDKWLNVSVDTSIILLGARYNDTVVREFAIKSLDLGLTDSLMLHYQLQLIQLLKIEPYHNNALARLLLHRALLNRRFGHFFFWNLRSQIGDLTCTDRWCVLLEMYCRGLSQTALRTILHQVEALEEIRRISNETINETDRREAIMKQFNLKNVLMKVNKFYNPLNITIPMDRLIHERCRVMDSAKRPLWLEWTNSDPFAKFNELDVSAIIFKTGDDLRQDMLTLQVKHSIEN